MVTAESAPLSTPGRRVHERRLLIVKVGWCRRKVGWPQEAPELRRRAVAIEIAVAVKRAARQVTTRRASTGAVTVRVMSIHCVRV